MENKKVANATPLDYDGIHFRSELEAATYRIFKTEKLNIEYEKHKFTLWQEPKPRTVKIYERFSDKKAGFRRFGLNKYKLKDLTFLPDFVITLDVIFIVIECKGFPNDRYPVKKKLFIEYLEKNHPGSVFMEVKTIKEARQACDFTMELIEERNEELQGHKLAG